MLCWYRRCSRSYLWNYRDCGIANDCIFRKDASSQL
nr:MAG TPA: hypothetical protein [Caudoviricetes sp.]